VVGRQQPPGGGEGLPPRPRPCEACRQNRSSPDSPGRTYTSELASAPPERRIPMSRACSQARNPSQPSGSLSPHTPDTANDPQHRTPSESRPAPTTRRRTQTPPPEQRTPPSELLGSPPASSVRSASSNRVNDHTSVERSILNHPPLTGRRSRRRRPAESSPAAPKMVTVEPSTPPVRYVVTE
jgi:hypothetical protein